MGGNVAAERTASFAASLLAGAGSVWAAWLLLAGTDGWLPGHWALIAPVLLGVPALALAAVGRLVPRPAWAMAAAPFGAYTFLLPLLWEGRGGDVRGRDEVPFGEVAAGAAIVALLAGVLLAGFVALGAALRERGRRRGAAAGPAPHP